MLMFAIAETIQCGTVDELSERMSITEMFEWREYFNLKEKERKKREKEAKRKRR